MNLKQISYLQQYLDAFDKLHPTAGIQEDKAFNFFLLELVDSLQMLVRMFKLKTLNEAYFLAKLQEITVAAIKDKPKPVTKIHKYPYT